MKTEIRSGSVLLRLQIALICFSLPASSTAQKYDSIDSAIQVLRCMPIDSVRSYMTIYMPAALKRLPAESSLQKALETIDFCKQNYLDRALIYACINAGNLIPKTAPMDAYKLFSEGLNHAEETNDPMAVFDINYQMSVYQADLGLYDEAMKHILIAKSIVQDFRGSEDYYNCLKQEMDINIHLREYQRALKIGHALARPGREKWKKGGEGRARRKINLYNSLGLIHENLQQHDSAVEYYSRSMKIAGSIKDEFWCALAGGNLGGVYYKMGRYKEAIALLKKDIAVSNRYKQRQSAINSMLVLCDIYLKSGKIDKAEVCLDSIKRTSSVYLKEDMLPPEYWQIKAEIARINGDYRAALEAQKRYTTTEIARLDKLEANRIAKMETRFDIGRRQREFEALKLVTTIQERSVKNQRIGLIASYTTLALALLLIFILIRSYSNQKKNLLFTQKHHDELASTNARLREAYSDLSSVKEDLQERERMLRNTILRSPVPMCLLHGPLHKVEVINTEMLQLFEKSEADMMHKPVLEDVNIANKQEWEEQLTNVYVSGRSFKAREQPITLVLNSHKRRSYFNFVFEPYYEGQVIAGVMIISTDVTEQVRARRKVEKLVAKRTKDLELLNVELQKSSDELEQFIYIASHDLVEPVRKINIFSQKLAEHLVGNTDDQSRGMLTKIHSSSIRLDELMRNVLAYSEVNGRQEDFEMVNLNRVIASVAAKYDLLIEQKQASIHYNNLPTIEAIAMQMERLFGNLLSNSLKFSKKSEPPRISITSVPVTDPEKKELNLLHHIDYIKITVKDNGIGFQPEYGEQIFKIFRRLHRASDYEGTGIGLSMCRKIARNHNGLINAAGSSEDGAVFNIILPQRRVVKG